MTERVVIVGGGLAAVRTAQALRDLKYPGEVMIVSDEVEWPYDRPPLSKALLLGKTDEANIRLMTPEKAAELGVEVRLSQRVRAVDREARQLLLSGGESIDYGRLVVATGARPLGLPALEGYANVAALRSLGDARRVRSAIQAKQRIALIGGGFIGLEIASSARELGCEVMVIEAAAAPLAPVLGTELSTLVQRWHETKGVVFHCGATLSAVRGSADRVTELVLENDRGVAADTVIVGIGTAPNVEWLHSSGLELHRGLVCDAWGRTNDPFVFGVGDAVCRHTADGCHPTRHWTATTEQARRVARLICGVAEPGPVIDDFYFWSDQYGLRLQFAGRMPQQPRIAFAVGAPGEEKFVALCGTQEQVTAVFSCGSPRDFNRLSAPLRRGEQMSFAA